AAAFSPDRTLLATLAQSGQLRIHEPATGRETRSWNAGAAGAGALAFTHDGREVVTYSRKDLRTGIQFWDAAGGQERRFFPATGVRKFAFSPDGRTLFFLSGLADVHRIDLQSGRTLPALKATPRSA